MIVCQDGEVEKILLRERKNNSDGSAGTRAGEHVPRRDSAHEPDEPERLSHGPVFVVLWVKAGDPGEGGGRLGGLGKIFVAFEANRDADLRLSRACASEVAAGAEGRTTRKMRPRQRTGMLSPRVISEGMRSVSSISAPSVEWSVGEKEDSARTEILRESNALQARLRAGGERAEEDKETAVRHGVQLQLEEWS